MTPGVFAALVTAPGDIVAAYDEVHLVAIRFDLCDRAAVGACPEGAAGRLRLVLQPLYTSGDATLARDIAVHAFYPIPAVELAGVITELRALARIQDDPRGAPLRVSPALSAATPSAAYLARLRALVLRYARHDRLARITTFGRTRAPPRSRGRFAASSGTSRPRTSCGS